MASSGGAAEAKQLRVLLPFTCDNLRIPDELAGEIGAEEALVVGPAGGKVKFWPVEVGRDGDGAFLGRRWPEFAEACGVGAGWLLVLRHRGRGLLSAKAFDAACCLKELGAPAPPAAEATPSSKDSIHKPQFIRVLPRDFMEKMLIPAKFVQQYIPEFLYKGTAIVLGPIGKVYSIKLEMGQSGVFFAGGWSQLIKFHDITEANSLLLRYEGNMVFTLKVYESNGYQRVSKHMENRSRQISTMPDIEEQQEAPSASTQKEQETPSASTQKQQKAPSVSTLKQQEAPPASIKKQYENNLPGSNREKEPQGSSASLDQTPFKIGPPSWIEKQINADSLKNHIVLPKAFCDAIGLRECCAITLKTSRNGRESWQVHGLPCNKSYQLVKGWRRFCRENSLKEGDICTFNIIESTMWHVIINRCKEKITQEQQEASFGSSMKRKCWNDSLSREDQNKRKGFTTSLKNVSSPAEGVYEIGPPAWIKKEMNTRMIKKCLSIPAAFCDAIGLREACMITFKTSLSSTSSWDVRILPYKDTSHQIGSGWKKFCQENAIKEGDVCTFNVIETKLWHVVIERC